MIHKILRLFDNTLIVNDKHYVLNRDKLTQQIQIHLSQKQKNFSECFFTGFKSYIEFLTLGKKNKTVLAQVFPEIPAPKNMLR